MIPFLCVWRERQRDREIQRDRERDRERNRETEGNMFLNVTWVVKGVEAITPVSTPTPSGTTRKHHHHQIPR
jgi:heme/copper-type cytochrome/quinol oxidase subunit 2